MQKQQVNPKAVLLAALLIFLLILGFFFLIKAPKAEATSTTNSKMAFIYQIDRVKIKQQCLGDPQGNLTCYYFTWESPHNRWDFAGVESFNAAGKKETDTFKLNDTR